MSQALKSPAIELNENDLDLIVGGHKQHRYVNSNNIVIQQIIQTGNNNVAIIQAGQGNQTNRNRNAFKKR